MTETKFKFAIDVEGVDVVITESILKPSEIKLKITKVPFNRFNMSNKKKHPTPEIDIDSLRYHHNQLSDLIKNYDNELAILDGAAGRFKVSVEEDRWGSTVTYLEFYHRETVREINNIFRFTEMTNDRQGHRAPIEDLQPHLMRFKKRAEDNEEKAIYYKPLIEYIEEKIALQLESYKFNLEKGQVAFSDLWLMFSPDKEVIFSDAEVLVGATLKSAGYKRSWSGVSFSIDAEYIGSDGDKFFGATKTAAIYSYEGTRSVDNLPIKLVSDEKKVELTERGKKYVDLASGAHYMNYNGEMLYRSYFGNRYYKASGRCMVDVRMFRAHNENYDRDYHDEDTETQNVEFDNLWRVTPWIRGFSFPTKEWGEINVEKVENISYDDDAFDRLVLPPRKVGNITINPKEMIRSLVEEGNSGFTDVISGKGGGCIFLLHGPPGTGKTLTAEAVAELLHKPMYSVSVGELGTNTETLEKKLRKVLELATTWDAVVLIDEADIFLEERTSQDVERNALVAVFLRMLEYYQGVMFLTTNRVNNFDRAFHSRISIALNYPRLPETDRSQVWTNLLSAANIEGLDTNKLASHDINGRQIKNAIRIAIALGKADQREVSTTDIENVIGLAAEFNKTIGEINADEEDAAKRGII